MGVIEERKKVIAEAFEPKWVDADKEELVEFQKRLLAHIPHWTEKEADDRSRLLPDSPEIELWFKAHEHITKLISNLSDKTKYKATYRISIISLVVSVSVLTLKAFESLAKVCQ